MMILAEGLAESKTLESLKIDKNNLTMCGRDIAYILHENTILTDLDLGEKGRGLALTPFIRRAVAILTRRLPSLCRFR
jgi:hypothetical protein